MSSTVFKKSSCELNLHGDTALHRQREMWGKSRTHKCQMPGFSLFYCQALTAKSETVAYSLIRCCFMSCEGTASVWSTHGFPLEHFTRMFSQSKNSLKEDLKQIWHVISAQNEVQHMSSEDGALKALKATRSFFSTTYNVAQVFPSWGVDVICSSALKSSPSKKGRVSLMVPKCAGPGAAWSASQLPCERDENIYDLRGARSFPTLEDEGK